MFEPTSRYANIDDATLEREKIEEKASGGITTTTITTTTTKKITYRYKRRRFIPIEKQPTIFEITVTAGDRLDQITARLLGDSEQYWQICDANFDDSGAMHPLDLMEKVGNVLNIPLPRRG